MVVLDSSITNVALPTIQHELHFSASSLQWVITAYALCFGGFLLLGGRLADLFGRRRMLLTGIIAFTTLSFLIGLAQTSSELIGLRALQGLSAAFMSPAALSIVLVTFRDGQDRNKALGFWSLVATGGAAVGILLGGWLTQYYGWRWDFFVNVPVGVIIALLIAKIVPVHEGEEKRSSLDAPGAVLVTASLMTLVYGISQAPEWGWLAGKTLAMLGAAAALLMLFVFNESRAKRPLMPLSIFKVRNVTGGNMIIAPLFATVLGTFFLMTLYLQAILHYSPVKTGLAFLPLPILLGFMATRMPKLVGRYGFRRFLIAGPLITAIGLLLLSRLPVDGSYMTDLLPALLIMPIGIGMTIMPTIAAATSGVPAHEAGLASGLVSTSQQMGGALGLSILSGIAASAAAGAVHLSASASVVHGYHVAFLADVIFMLIAAAVAVGVIRQPRSSQRVTHP